MLSASPGSEPRTISVPAAARQTGLSETTIRRVLMSGDLEGYRAGDGGKFLIPPEALNEWIRLAAETEETP